MTNSKDDLKEKEVESVNDLKAVAYDIIVNIEKYNQLIMQERNKLKQINNKIKELLENET